MRRTRGQTGSGAAAAVAEISAAAVRANLVALRAALAGGAALWPVVKADAYGHGLELLLPVLAPAVDGLAVSAAVEAERLRALGWAGPLLCFLLPPLGAAGDAAIARLAAAGVTWTVASADDAERVGALAPAAEAHLEIDTGMGRAGVWHAEAGELLGRLRAAGRPRLTGAYTHFAVDGPDRSFSRRQLERFLAAVEAGGGRAGLLLHAANSAAALDLPQSRLDLVRPGLAVYGYEPAADAPAGRLRPCLRLTASLLQVKRVPAGTSVGYGRDYVCREPSRLGLVGVGYADGYPRQLGDRAVVGVGGATAPVRGRVSMDQIVVDLTAAPAAAPGDAVEVISPDPAAPHSVASLARLAGTIPYELTCRLGARVRRRLVG